MNAKAEVEGAGLDKVKLAAAALLLAGGIYAYYHFAVSSTLLGVLALLVIGGIGVAVAMQTEPGRALWQFAAAARMEVRKVVWPTRQETLQTTLVVIVMVIILAIVLWLFDWVLMAILQAVTGKGG
jgi:preprotein translocase subunit SecE